MNLDGGYLTVLIGSTVPTPAKPGFLQSLEQVQVTVSQDEPSGFQIRCRAERAGLRALKDYPLLQSSQVKPFNRVIIVVTLRGTPHVLMDGVISDVQHQPRNSKTGGLITITGEDLTLLMDLEEKQKEHPGLNAPAIVTKVLGKYARYGVIPKVIPTRLTPPPSPTKQIPVQCETDLQYLQLQAEREGCVFFITPGPIPGTSTAYWGPPPSLGLPQKALTVDMGSSTNVDSLSFRYQALAAKPFEGHVQDPNTGKSSSVKSSGGSQIPLATGSAMKIAKKQGRVSRFRRSGLSTSEARSRMKAAANLSAARTLVGEGQLDAQSYEGVLLARKLVGVRGVGYTHDGLYLVTKVTHTLQRGSYMQSFTIQREGTGSTVPVVRV